MKPPEFTTSRKPFDLPEHLLLSVCEIVRAVQFWYKHGRIRHVFSYKLFTAGTSVWANYGESDDASIFADFIAKNRTAIKEAKKIKFRLRVCHGADLLDGNFDPVMR